MKRGMNRIRGGSVVVMCKKTLQLIKKLTVYYPLEDILTIR